MNEWAILQDALFLLLGAMLLGALFERFKQNAMLGYLLARTLLGAHALDALPNRDAILSVAELGVALLLFAIGMEFFVAQASTYRFDRARGRNAPSSPDDGGGGMGWSRARAGYAAGDRDRGDDRVEQHRACHTLAI